MHQLYILVILELHPMIEIYSGAGFPMAFGHLNEKSPCTSDISPGYSLLSPY